MFTLMPVAAFAAAGPIAVDTSAFVATNGDQTVKANAAEPVEFTFAANNAETKAVTDGTTLSFLVCQLHTQREYSRYRILHGIPTTTFRVHT